MIDQKCEVHAFDPNMYEEEDESVYMIDGVVMRLIQIEGEDA